MPHPLAREAEIELDDIWLYVAKKSGSMDVADGLVDSISSRFYLLARYPFMGRRRDVAILHVVPGSRNIQALFAHQSLTA